MYCSYLVHRNSRESMIKSSDSLSTIDIRNHTHKELVDKLKNNGVEWENLSSDEKYGTFYKLKKKKGGKIVISSLSEAFDARNMKKYSVFMFGS